MNGASDKQSAASDASAAISTADLDNFIALLAKPTRDGKANIGQVPTFEGLETWIERLGVAGVRADRAGSPDLLGQLKQATGQAVDTVVCNLLDDDPGLRLNSVLAARWGAVVVAGAQFLTRLTEARRLFIVVETGSPSGWWSDMISASGRVGARMLALANDYPLANPSLLLHALLGRRLRPGNLPTQQRVLMIDAATAIAVGRIAAHRQAMSHVPLAVRDHLCQSTHYLLVPLGTPVRDVVDGLAPPDTPPSALTLRHAGLVFMGHILRDNIASSHAVIGHGELTMHLLPNRTTMLADPCIRCHWCAESCPARVQPAGLLDAAQSNDLTMARRYALDGCIECGVCSYVCPSKLPLLAGIRVLRRLAGSVDKSLERTAARS